MPRDMRYASDYRQVVKSARDRAGYQGLGRLYSVVDACRESILPRDMSMHLAIGGFMI